MNFEEHTKVKMPRELFVSSVEAAIDEVHKAQRLNMDIRRVFQKCGLDPYNNENMLFENHLELLPKEAMYHALTKHQKILNLI